MSNQVVWSDNEALMIDLGLQRDPSQNDGAMNGGNTLRWLLPESWPAEVKRRPTGTNACPTWQTYVHFASPDGRKWVSTHGDAHGRGYCMVDR
jgi:hypothetical protein